MQTDLCLKNFEVSFANIKHATSSTLLSRKKLIRIATVPMALAYPLRGQSTYMQQQGLEVLMISSDGKELPKVLEQEICAHRIVPMTRSITPFQDLVVLYKLIRIFKKEKPDIVHTETPKAGLLGMLAAWLCNVKIRIHTVAGLPLMVEKGFKLKVLQFIEKLTYSAATNVWPNSNSLKNYILAHKFTTEKKLTVIGKGSSNGIDVARFDKLKLDEKILNDVKASIHYDPEFTYLLFVGRLVLDKGIVELVNVFTELHKSDSSLRLILVGHYERQLDPLPRYIEYEIESNAAIVQISWTGYVEYFMTACDYFVFPSYREGFPNVLLEAAAMQLPIICSRIAGNVDIVVNDETGLIFESQNEPALKGAILKALQDRHRSKAMAETLHQIVTTSYKREVFWVSMFDEYQSLISKRIK